MASDNPINNLRMHNYERGMRVDLALEDWRNRGVPIMDAADLWAVTPEEIFDEFRVQYPEEAVAGARRLRKALAWATVLGPVLLLWCDVKQWFASLLGIRNR